jgi:hypothetical protein
MHESSISHAMNDQSVNAPAQIEVVVQPVAEATVNEPFSVDTHAADTHAVDTYAMDTPTVDAPALDASPEEHSDAKTTAVDAASFGSVQAETAEAAGAEPIDTEPVTAIDEWTVDPAPAAEHDKDTSTEPTSDSGKVLVFVVSQEQRFLTLPFTGIKNGLEREIGIETSRWAPPKSSDPVVEGEGQEKVQDDEPSNTKPRRIPTVNFAYDPNNADKLRDVTQKLASLKSQFLLGKAF